MKRFLLALALFPLIAAGQGVDTDGAPLSPSSRFGDVDGENSTIADVFNAANTNAYTKAETDARIVELAPAPGDYLNVSNRAMNAVQEETDPTVPEWAKNPVPPVQTETDPTVPSWAKADAPPTSGLTTNDVCNIVTNEVAAEWSSWTLSGLPDGATNVLGPFYDGQVGWSLSYDLGDDSYYGDIYASEDATEVVIECWEVSAQEDYHITTATRTYKPPRNALGLAREKDLPQKTPVDEILFNGADGKIYHLRIGAGGSIDIYTEVAQ